MSDEDLLQKLWESDEASALTNQAARRIEELEADLRKMALDCMAVDWQAAEAYQAQLAAEAKLAKAMKALAQIGKTYTADKSRLIHSDLWIIEMVQTTLAELKGETND